MATLFLNHFNGIDGSTALSDEVAGVTWTPSGTAQLDTANKKFGSASLYLPNSSAFATATGYTDPEGGSFTLEGWFYCASGGGSSSGRLAVFNNSGNEWASVDFDSFNSQIGILVTDSGGTDIVNSSTSCTIARDTWFHVALVRDNTAGTWSAYFNGTRYLNVSAGNPGGVLIDFNFVSVSAPPLYFDEVRLTDEAQYSGASYTVPTTEFAIAILLAPSSDTVSTTAAAGLTTEILLAASDTATTSDTMSLLTGTEFLLAADSVVASESASLDTAILLESTDTATTSDSATLTVPPTVVLVPPTGGAAAQTDLNVGGVDKPAIPPTTDLPLAFIRVLEPMKQNIEIITGRRGGRIEVLEDDATLTEAVEKINQIVARLMQ